MNKKTEKTIRGIISVNSKGVGFIESADSPLKTVEIENRWLNTALNRDEVEVLPHPKELPNGNLAGEVIKILKRVKTEFVGSVEKNKDTCFILPDDRRMYRDIFIPSKEAKKIKNGDKVLVKIKTWPNQNKSPIGEIVKVIGKKGEHNTEIESIVLDKGLKIEFPKEVSREAEVLAKNFKKIPEEEIKKRRDMRETLTFTIDPKDAKDFDDAISIKKLDEERYEIGVHIADVSFFVREESVLDKEARKRAFSIYLVDRTIPMLPEELSNDLCSLNPKEEKLSFSAVFVMDKNGKIEEKWFGKTIILSDKRFTYEEAQEILNRKKGEFFKELSILNSIALNLRKEKTGNGAIDFEENEVKFILDEKGKPLGVEKKERLETHKLIEEFMLLANKEVAKFMDKSIKKNRLGSFIYRIHDLPDRDKILDLAIFLRALGYNLSHKDGEVSAKDINKILTDSKGKEEESLIKSATVRSMSKAIYTTKNIGHFGLAFEFYTHFTSPIRRYPDLLGHRILENTLKNKPIDQKSSRQYERICIESSEKEIEVAEAERASIKYKQVEYMENHVGEVFDAIISGVSEWGIYVEEVNTKSEGLIRIKDLTDDTYILEKKNYALVGSSSKKKFHLGDKVKVKLIKANVERKILDFILV